MLKGIPNILSPQLFKTLMEMGHGDEIVLADGNFPANSLAQRIIRADGHQIPPLLDAMLKFFPLDTYVEKPVMLMQTVSSEEAQPEVWETYQKIITTYHKEDDQIDWLERHAFYERAKQAYAIVATSETALYGNIILKKGVVEEKEDL